LRRTFRNPETPRQPDDIDALWDLFAAALKFAESDEAEDRTVFTAAYDNAAERHGVGWNLTMGLYWIRPWNYPTLEGRSQVYIKKKLRIPIEMNGPKGRCNANDYLRVLALLEHRFQEETYPVHSFPELSYAAWLYKGEPTPPPFPDPDGDGEDDGGERTDGTPPPIVGYALDNIVAEGCFLEKERLQEILERFRAKKNLILQGPPGTGKTWLAKRLGFALMGQKDDRRLRAVQFHPNLSYEDFVRGWRPEGDGKLSLVDGPLLEMVKAASQEPSDRFVMVIEEINRGNPAQIFGETLTLLEDDKRTPDEALELCYRREEGERVFIPDNLYVIGTMNVADRSLALVDFALRRRFAFVDLEPVLGKLWHDWVQREFELDSDVLWEIEKRILALNAEITADVTLGRQFCVGHSFVTPAKGARITDARKWFRQVVATEIGPLLDEYWFDALDKAQKARERLIEGV